jgi:hypothetical protein
VGTTSLNLLYTHLFCECGILSHIAVFSCKVAIRLFCFVLFFCYSYKIGPQSFKSMHTAVTKILCFFSGVGYVVIIKMMIFL